MDWPSKLYKNQLNCTYFKVFKSLLQQKIAICNVFCTLRPKADIYSVLTQCMRKTSVNIDECMHFQLPIPNAILCKNNGKYNVSAICGKKDRLPSVSAGHGGVGGTGRTPPMSTATGELLSARII